MRWLFKLNLVQLTTSSTEVACLRMHCTLVNHSHHSVPPHLQLVLLPTVYNHHVLQPQGAPNTNLAEGCDHAHSYGQPLLVWNRSVTLQLRLYSLVAKVAPTIITWSPTARSVLRQFHQLRREEGK